MTIWSFLCLQYTNFACKSPQDARSPCPPAVAYPHAPRPNNGASQLSDLPELSAGVRAAGNAAGGAAAGLCCSVGCKSLRGMGMALSAGGTGALRIVLFAPGWFWAQG